MKLIPHQEMVRSLAKTPDLILASLTPEKCNLLHMQNGISDEWFELQIAIRNADNKNILEELGDLLFYTEGLVIGIEDLVPNIVSDVFGLNETMQKLFQIVKRHIFYEQPLDNIALINVYKNLIEWIEYYAKLIGKDLRDVRKHNMDKLAERYKNYKYSNDAAKERKDKTLTEQ